MNLRFLFAFALVTVAGCSAEPTPAEISRQSHEDEEKARGGIAAESSERPSLTFDSALTVEDCVKYAERSSLTVRAFKARLEAARGAAEAASEWPNPTVDYTAEDIGLNVNSSRTRALLQQELVGYPIFTFWTKGLETAVARADQARTTAQVEDDKRLLRLDIGRAYYELLASDDAVRNESEAVEIAVKLADAAAKRRKLGDASAVDEARARTEALEARRDLSAARKKRAIDGMAFALALGAERPTPVKLADGWPTSLPAEIAAAGTAALVEKALATRPDIHEAEATVVRASRSAELEDRRALPLAQWNVSAGARQGPDGYGAVFVAGGPIPLFDQNSGNKTRARAELLGAVTDLEKTRRQVAFEVESSLLGWSRASAELEEFSEPIARAREANLDATRRLFQAGEVSYVDLLQAQRDAVAARRSLSDGRKEAALSRWKLLLAVGAGGAAAD